jgi:hypothetical protein
MSLEHRAMTLFPFLFSSVLRDLVPWLASRLSNWARRVGQGDYPSQTQVCPGSPQVTCQDPSPALLYRHRPGEPTPRLLWESMGAGGRGSGRGLREGNWLKIPLLHAWASTYTHLCPLQVLGFLREGRECMDSSVRAALTVCALALGHHASASVEPISFCACHIGLCPSSITSCQVPGWPVSWGSSTLPAFPALPPALTGNPRPSYHNSSLTSPHFLPSFSPDSLNKHPPSREALRPGQVGGMGGGVIGTNRPC